MPSCALPQKKERIRMLLAAGCSHIQIMRRTGLSRRTISRIAKEGRRKLVAADISDERPAGFDQECLSRCRGCGARIYLWPCMQCEVRAKAESRDEVRRLVKKVKP
jgi:hypothetical protein